MVNFFSVPNSIPGHDTPELEIFGMGGVPAEDLARHQRGEPPVPFKRLKVSETELLPLLAAQKAAIPEGTKNPLPGRSGGDGSNSAISGSKNLPLVPIPGTNIPSTTIPMMSPSLTPYIYPPYARPPAGPYPHIMPLSTNPMATSTTPTATILTAMTTPMMQLPSISSPTMISRPVAVPLVSNVNFPPVINIPYSSHHHPSLSPLQNQYSAVNSMEGKEESKNQPIPKKSLDPILIPASVDSTTGKWIPAQSIFAPDLHISMEERRASLSPYNQKLSCSNK